MNKFSEKSDMAFHFAACVAEQRTDRCSQLLLQQIPTVSLGLWKMLQSTAKEGVKRLTRIWYYYEKCLILQTSWEPRGMPELYFENQGVSKKYIYRYLHISTFCI